MEAASYVRAPPKRSSQTRQRTPGWQSDAYTKTPRQKSDAYYSFLSCLNEVSARLIPLRELNATVAQGWVGCYTHVTEGNWGYSA